jgi:hypothetical protein
MLSLTITAAADALIRKALAETRVEGPVVYLIEVSPPIEVPAELRKAIAEDSDEAKIRKLAEDQFSENLLKGPRRLVPAIYPRTQFPKRFLTTVDGIPFVVPPNLEKKLEGATLDIADRGLVLRNADGVVVLPQ